MNGVLSELQAMQHLDTMSPLWTISTLPNDRLVIVSAAGPTGPITVRGVSRQDCLNSAVYLLREGITATASAAQQGRRT